MLAVEVPKSRRPLKGSPLPRIAPPMPARHMLARLEACAADLDLTFMEWQRIAGRYMTALTAADKWLFSRFAAVVSRQNGKTEIIKPRVLLGFELGRKMLHTAQDRSRPRKSTFEPLADFFQHIELGEERRAKYGVIKIREANGQEEIRCENGAKYTIAAPRSGGARGDSVDDIFVDEVREAEDYALDAIIRPTVIARPNPQVLYFSNAGHSNSVLLNDLRARRDDDRHLAYLEWSAPPELARTDPRAWAAANPALGTTIDLDTLADAAVTMQPEDFDTEHLCRWVISMRERLVQPEEWLAQQFGPVGAPLQAVIAIKMDISGERMSAVAAWPRDDKIALELVADITGSPINVNALGPELARQVRAWRPKAVGFDPYTDADLARYFPISKSVIGRDYAVASEGFARRVRNRQFVIHDEGNIIGQDLEWTTRKDSTRGSWIAVKADDTHANTAAEAAIRAAWLALPDPAPTSFVARIH